MDVSNIEAAEASIDQFIERRARDARDAAVIDEAWWDSEIRHRDRRREENREAWHGFHPHMQELHASLSEEHRAKARPSSRSRRGGGCVLNGPMRRYKAGRRAMYG